MEENATNKVDAAEESRMMDEIEVLTTYHGQATFVERNRDKLIALARDGFREKGNGLVCLEPHELPGPANPFPFRTFYAGYRELEERGITVPTQIDLGYDPEAEAVVGFFVEDKERKGWHFGIFILEPAASTSGWCCGTGEP